MSSQGPSKDTMYQFSSRGEIIPAALHPLRGYPPARGTSATEALAKGHLYALSALRREQEAAEAETRQSACGPPDSNDDEAPIRRKGDVTPPGLDQDAAVEWVKATQDKTAAKIVESRHSTQLKRSGEKYPVGCPVHAPGSPDQREDAEATKKCTCELDRK